MPNLRVAFLPSSAHARGVADVAGVTLCVPWRYHKCSGVRRRNTGTIFDMMSRSIRGAVGEVPMGCEILVRRDGCRVHGGGEQHRRQQPDGRH
jgi:hypothetical protein